MTSKNYYGLAHKINKSDERQFLWKQQRKERGFDSTELWNLDYTIICFIQPRLKAFANNVGSYPPFLTKEAWQEELNKMVNAFNIMVEESKYYNLSVEEESIVNEGFTLFKERFFHLWK